MQIDAIMNEDSLKMIPFDKGLMLMLAIRASELDKYFTREGVQPELADSTYRTPLVNPESIKNMIKEYYPNID